MFPVLRTQLKTYVMVTVLFCFLFLFYVFFVTVIQPVTAFEHCMPICTVSDGFLNCSNGVYSTDIVNMLYARPYIMDTNS